VSATRFPVVATIVGGWRLVLRRWRTWLVLAGALQLVVVLIAAPLLTTAGVAAIRSTGVWSLTTATLPTIVSSPWAAAVLILIALVAATAIAVQSMTLLTAARLQREHPDQLMPAPRELGRGLGARLRALAKPSSLLLVPYLLIVAPLGHVALGSALTTWIAIPGFIGGELMKSPGTAVGYTLIIAAIWYLNLRLVLVLPMLALGEPSVPRAFAASWRATGWLPWRIVLIILQRTVLQGIVIVLALVGLAIGATALADAVAPDAAVIVAAIALGIGQVFVFLLIALIAAADAQMLLAAAGWPSLPAPAATAAADPRARSRGRRILAVGVVIVAVIAAAGASIGWYPTLDRLDEGESLVIAHRGDTSVAVENTIEALEAAAAGDADLVEFDVQQTSDGDWVVMHDFELTRLTGSPGAVADMTLAEATALTVRANGFEGRVPSMREWVRRAVELEQPLLIEIKPHGGETDDYLEGFFAILDEEGVMPYSIFHSLSGDVVDGQKAMRPDAYVGEILALNIGGMPETPADFIVVEDWSYTTELRTDAWDSGVGVFVWTIDEPEKQRWYLREPVDGIVTDELLQGQQERASISDETGFTPRLIDALGRLTTAF
jgi:glycerophosphoryl diester phosphodiesterase